MLLPGICLYICLFSGVSCVFVLCEENLDRVVSRLHVLLFGNFCNLAVFTAGIPDNKEEFEAMQCIDQEQNIV